MSLMEEENLGLWIAVFMCLLAIIIGVVFFQSYLNLDWKYNGKIICRNAVLMEKKGQICCPINKTKWEYCNFVSPLNEWQINRDAYFVDWINLTEAD